MPDNKTDATPMQEMSMDCAVNAANIISEAIHAAGITRGEACLGAAIYAAQTAGSDGMFICLFDAMIKQREHIIRLGESDKVQTDGEA